MATTTEVERKYEVPVDYALPDLTRLPSVAAVDPPAEHELDATYYDTPDLRLAAGRVTMRRRTGGTDAGWHVKRPVSDLTKTGTGDRTETHSPLTDPAGGVPAEVAAQVRELTHGEPLEPVAVIHTRRLERPLRGRDGTVLALVADDLVAATAGDPGTVQSWREVEVELVDGGRELLDEVEARLRATGARPAGTASKLARVLGDRWPAPDPLREYLAKQRDALRDNEAGVRAGDAEAVHDMRVATRRLRSTLRTFRPLLPADRTEPLRGELRWLGERLGAVRDGDVMAARLAEAVAAEPPELVRGPVAERIRERLGARTGRARELLVEALDSSRYRMVLADLDRVAPEGEPTGRELLRPARKAVRRADRRLAAADEATGPARDLQLHEARKAYKRARYAAEAVGGTPGRRLVKALTGLQDVLGAHQDAIVTGELLRELAQRADDHGENAFTYGVLLGRQREAAAHSLTGLPRARRKAERRKVRRWLKG
jgi:CHAD domain-containing protein